MRVYTLGIRNTKGKAGVYYAHHNLGHVLDTMAQQVRLEADHPMPEYFLQISEEDPATYLQANKDNLLPQEISTLCAQHNLPYPKG